MAGGVKGQPYINQLLYEPDTSGVGTITVMISYGDAEAQTTILVTAPTDDNIRDQILSLGKALEKAAQSPQPLFSYPKKSQ
jgi:hypothetical protein